MNVSAFKENLEKIIIKDDLKPLKTKLIRSNNYKITGNNVEIDQGCIFVGYPHQNLSSSAFETCAPLIMLGKKDEKRLLAHIDADSKPQEIVTAVKNHFSPKEIENASYHYYRGAELEPTSKNLGRYAIKIIEEALELLGVKGQYHGALKSPYDKVIVNSDGLKIKEYVKPETRL